MMVDRQRNDWLRGYKRMEIRMEVDQPKMVGPEKTKPGRVAIHHATMGVTTYSQCKRICRKDVPD